MAKKSWYAWKDASGQGGICTTWDECKAACAGRSGERHQGFATKAEAWAFAYPDTPMPVEQNKQNKTAAIPQGKAASTFFTMADFLPAVPQADEKPIRIDPSRISHAEPTDKVNQYCDEYHFEHLSRDQRRAVEAVNGKVLLFAVPGSGKTTVLIARVGYMIHACGINPGAIVSLTFTKASAAEMENRYQKRFPDDAITPKFRTIHSFAFSTVIPRLRRAGYGVPSHLISDMKTEWKDGKEKKKSYERLIFEEFNKELKQIGKEYHEQKPVLLNGRKDREALQTAITGIKNTRMTRAQLRGKTIHLHSGNELPIDRAYKVYLDLCYKYHCMDYDDMLIYALDGLQKHPQVLAQLQNEFRYWSIDESQDNSPLQHDLLRLLVGEHGNLFMVGDDDQSIYAFRGAKPRLFQQFGMEQDVTVLTMGTNYRSACGIVKTAEEFIQHNKSHQDKQMNADHAQPGCIRFIYDLHREKHQYAKIVDTARDCIARGEELAVLYRENISALPLMFYLAKHDVPFFTAAKLSQLLYSPYVSGIIDLLRFSINQTSFSLFKKAQTWLHVYTPENNMQKLKRACQAAPDQKVLDVLAKMVEGDSSSINDLLDKAANAAPYDAILHLLREIEINQPKQSERMQINAILSTSALFNSIPSMLDAIETMKRTLGDTGKEDDEDDEDEDVLGEEGIFTHDSECELLKAPDHRITLSTMHSAKGLEFDHVMIIDYLMPPDVPYNSTQLVFDDDEEPGRLFYVAITRAKQTLDILTVQSYHGTSQIPHQHIRQYATICEEEEVLADFSATVPAPQDCVSVKLFGKYYGVPVGRKPGVYTNWDEAKAQTDHFPNPRNLVAKGFPTWGEAAAYTYPGGIPDEVRPVDVSIFRQYLVSHPTLRANWPQDIPARITQEILSLLHTDSLLSLAPDMQRKLNMNYLKAHPEAYDYSGMKALAYTVSYLPPNYYKVWTPLWKLLQKKTLPFHAKVLELGAGPGTAGLALLDFYGKLAASNPTLTFAVDYTAVEREAAFMGIISQLMEAMKKELPANLRVTTQAIHADAVDYMKQQHDAAYNLVLESNMLNEEENVTEDVIQVLGDGFARCLDDTGRVILIEPGRKQQIPILEKAVSSPALQVISEADITSVDMSSISLVEQCLQTGIRKKEISQHWFSVIIAERKVS